MARRRARRSGQHRITRWVFALIIVVAAAVILKGRLVVHDIRITGNRNILASRVVELSGLEIGTDMLRVDEQAIRRGIERDPYLQVARVEMQYPSTVAITVRESRPSAVIESLGIYLLIDEECRLLAFLSDREQAGVLVVTGVEVASQREGMRIGTNPPGQADDLQRLLGAVSANGVENQITELNVENLDNLYLMTPIGVQVLLGDDGQLAEKMIWFEVVYRQLVDADARGGTLDVSSARNGVYTPPDG